MSASDYYVVPESALTDLKAAIQAKSGGSGSMEFPDDYISEVESIETGGFTIDDFADGTTPSGAITLNSATSITKWAFVWRDITSISAPEVITAEEYAFANCRSMTSVYIPKLTTLSGTYSFETCSALTVIAFPSLTSESMGRTFNSCTSLVTVDWGHCWRISNQTHNNTTSLRNLVLRKSDEICQLQAWNSMTMGGIYNNPTSSTIYVPESLISTYQGATNWATAYSAGVTFAKIEGSYYETHYADGTAIGGGS